MENKKCNEEVTMQKAVYLSPSTQEGNIGAGAYGTEKKRMNQVCDVVEAELIRHGVITYRNKPEMSLSQIIADSNSKKKDYHFAIHSDASGAGVARGCTIFCYSKESKGYTLAQNVYAEVEPLTPAQDRGVRFKPTFAEIGKTNTPAALIEVSFHDNIFDATWIMASIEPLGIAISKGILKTLGITYIQKESNTKAIDWEASYEDEVKKRKEAEQKYNSLIQKLRVIE